MTSTLHKFGVRPKKLSNYVWSALDLVPVILPVAILGFGISLTTLLLIGKMYTWLAWLLGACVATVLTRYVVKSSSLADPHPNLEKRLYNLIALIIVILWVGFNMQHTSQHIFTDRDPATYAVTAVHLINNPSVTFFIPSEFVGLSDVSSESFGFSIPQGESGYLHAQGVHMLPALLGLVGRQIGYSNMLHLGPVIGGVALLAFYGFARFLVKPIWALAGMLIMAVSLPLVYFSRDIYSEPLALAQIFSTLSLLWIAHRSGRRSLWLIAGLIGGAGALIRVDALLTIAGLAVFIFYYILRVSETRFHAARKEAGFFLFGLLASSLLGWLDLSILSANYYALLRQLFIKQYLVLFAIIFLCFAINYKPFRLKLILILRRIKWLVSRQVVWTVFLGTALLLTSRPLWMKALDTNQNTLVASLQTQADLPIEPRTYAEITTNWIAWYIGPIAILGVIGLAIMASRTIERKDFTYSAFLVIFIFGCSYLLQPSIVPDQIWASRRLLPVVLPGLVLGGVFSLTAIERFFKRQQINMVLIGIIIMALMLSPLITTRPFLTIREMMRLKALEVICDVLPSNAAVLWTAQAQYELVQPTQEFCFKPAAGIAHVFPNRASQSQLSMMAKELIKQGKTPVIGVYGEHASHSMEGYSRENFKEVFSYEYLEIEKTLITPPRKIVVKNNSIFLGVIQEDGSVTPLNY
jgi:hypothetical protein